MRFEGKTVLMTAAAQGICREAVRLFVQDGATVIAVDRSQADLDQLLGAESGARIIAVQADCVREPEVEAAVRRALEVTGRIDILVNGIGGSTLAGRQDTPVDEMSLTDFLATLEINLVPTFLLCKHVVPVMKRQGAGKIVNVSSISARGEGLSNAAYSAAKAGVTSFTRKLSREVAKWSINCNAIAPGLTLTDRIQRSIERIPADVQASRVAAVPWGRLATPIDQAKVICFLASGEADFMTGVTVDVTGGQ
jgi:NAD(P)-dependent dehydrogenase (short-subunit alcohol dehydrogenase family)